VEEPAEVVFNDPPTDSLTGLPGRPLAKDAIAQRAARGGDFAVAFFFMDRFDSIHARYGQAVSEDLLLLLAQHLGQNFVENDSLFRWSGPSFLVILEIGSSLAALGRRVKEVATARLEKNIEGNGKSIILPVNCTWLIHKVTAGESAEVAFRKMDAFMVAKPSDAVAHR
jgi:GGDEF domain-containing protein